MNDRDGDDDGRDGETDGRDGEIDGRDGVVEGRDGVVEGRDGWVVVVVVEGREFFVGVAFDSLCGVAAGRLGGVFTFASFPTERVTGRVSTAFVRADGRALVGLANVEGRASPAFGRAALGSRCVGNCDARTRRASMAFVRACGVELRLANAVARASGLLRF